MNKQLIAATLGLLLLVPMTNVHADAKIYGRIHLSGESLDDGSDPSTYLSSNASYLGLKGSEKISRSLSLVWQLESAVDNTRGDFGGTLSGRNSYLGLKGSFGTVLAGVHDTPFKILARRVDLFDDQIGDSRNLISTPNGGTSFDLRPDNLVAWTSKDLGGIKVMVATVLKDGLEDADVISAHGIYSRGSLMVGGGFENHGEGVSGGRESSGALRVVASYKLKGNAIRIYGLLQQVTDAGGESGVDSQTIGGGISIKSGSNLFKAQIYQVEDLEDDEESGARLLAFGVEHKLSRRTKVYGAYAMTTNDVNASYSAFGGEHGEDPGAASDGDDPTGISLGIIHEF